MLYVFDVNVPPTGTTASRPTSATRSTWLQLVAVALTTRPSSNRGRRATHLAERCHRFRSRYRNVGVCENLASSATTVADNDEDGVEVGRGDGWLEVMGPSEAGPRSAHRMGSDAFALSLDQM
jgi:hypothetical protein